MDNGFPEVLHVDLDDIRHLEMRLRLLKDLISCEPMQSQRTDLLRYIPACTGTRLAATTDRLVVAWLA